MIGVYLGRIAAISWYNGVISVILHALISFTHIHEKYSNSLATHITKSLEGVYGSISHGWYVEGKDGRQYGLNKNVVENIEVTGNIHEILPVKT